MNLDFPKYTTDNKRDNSVQDELFLKKVNQSVTLKNGHQVICLPVNNDVLVLSDSQKMAEARLVCLSRK